MATRQTFVNKDVIQGSSSGQGAIELALWYKKDTMTVYISQCKNLPWGVSGRHDYVQTFFLEDFKGSRKLTSIVSGNKNPAFNTQINVCFIIFLFCDIY